MKDFILKSKCPIKMQYDVRGVQTRYVRMPMADQHKPSCVPCLQKPIYNTNTMLLLLHLFL